MLLLKAGLDSPARFLPLLFCAHSEAKPGNEEAGRREWTQWRDTALGENYSQEKHNIFTSDPENEEEKAVWQEYLLRIMVIKNKVLLWSHQALR